MLKILAYGCTSAAGPTVRDFWTGLHNKSDHSEIYLSPHKSRICRWKSTDGKSSLEKITSQLLSAWNQIKSQNVDLTNLGIIFASTKGCTEDFFTADNFLMNTDPLTPILDLFLKRAELNVDHFVCVSNACSSTIAALFLADQWILQKRVKSVLVLSADEIGPFVNRGFFALKALSQTTAQPFGAKRDGLQLGEAASALLVGDEQASGIEILGVSLDTEGFAVARPSHSGESLFKACSAILKSETPDLIVAHGTGTIANDLVEDQVFSRLFEKKEIPITSTKWSIGHTLGASASMDIIAACEILKTQEVFSIANTAQIDPEFKSRYHFGPMRPKKYETNRVLVTSLGFGGVHGAILLNRVTH